MDIWIVTNSDCPTGGYVSAWRTKEGAQAEADRLNAEARRVCHWVDEDELNG